MTLVALGAGLYGRLTGLDSRPLAVDEYYFVHSVGFILDEGVPQIPSGGYYVRGLLVQYLAAAAAALFGERMFAFRLPALLFGLLSVVLCWAYCRRFTSALLAGAVSVTLLVSSWSIEFSQFARMYTAFQSVTLFFLIALDEGGLRKNPRWYYAPHLAVVLAGLIHELGVLLAPLLLVPLVVDRVEQGRLRAGALRWLVASAAAAGICFVLARFDFRNLGVTARFPEGALAEGGAAESAYYWPELLFWSVSADPGLNLMIAGALVVAGLLAVGVWRRISGRPGIADAILVLLVISTLLHAFIFSVALLALLVFRYRIQDRPAHPRRRYVLLAVALSVAGAWVAYVTWHVLGQEAVGRSAALDTFRRAFFGWPNYYVPLMRPWANELPGLGALLAGSLAWHVVTKLRESPTAIFGHPGFVVLYVFTCLAVLRPPYTLTRYTFFIYPVILCVIALAVAEIAEKLRATLRIQDPLPVGATAAALYLVVFMAGGDFSPSHIRHIDSPAVVFRQGKFDRYAPTWHYRKDYKSPAGFLDGIEKGRVSRTVVVNEPPVSYYLEADHAVYLERAGRPYRNVSRNRGTVDLWSNRQLLSTPDELRRYTAEADVVWIVRDRDPRRHPFEPEEVWGDRLLDVSPRFVGVDGRIEVLRITLRS